MLAIARERTHLARNLTDKRQMAIERGGVTSPPAPTAAAGETEATRKRAPPSAPSVRVITLEHGEHLDSTLYRFEKGCYLQFCPGASLLGRKVYLYTNYVVSDDDGGGGSAGAAEQAEFVRNQYYGLEWRTEDGAGVGAGVLVADTGLYCQLRLQRAGSFHYYFVYDTPEPAAGPRGSGWFGVSPTLCAGGRPLPLDGLMCQTVLAKCLGPLARWERVLRVAREAGYNMLHFTPVQTLGASGSGYSIADQLRLDPRYGATLADLENLVSKIRTEWKMLSICDIVLNHTANETPWLAEHPEATYNCSNCPHLRPAALLDAVLARLTASVARGEYEARGVPRRVTHHDHVEAVRALLATQLVPEARLHEMYVCDVDEMVRDFCRAARDRLPAPARPRPDGPTTDPPEELKLVPDPARRRLRATVDLELALRLYNVRDEGDGAGAGDEEARVARCGEALRRALDRLNEAAAERVREHLRAAVDNVVAGMRYRRLAADGPREEEVSARCPLAERYFLWPLDVERASLAELEAALYGAQAAHVAAHNGWVMNADPLADFAARDGDGRVYLRRELIAWGDSVKLRYGAGPDDSPFLWAHMREYVELTAEVFDGVRLDNCHSTPLHVAEYMLDAARNLKPDLFAVAELFTDSAAVDNVYVNRLGVTCLVREAQSASDARDQGRLVHRYGGRPAGAFLRRGRRPARARVAPAMLLDLTHDNPAPVSRRSALDLAPCAALVAMACCATGSTRGYDELVPHHVHVVDETRLYAEWADAGTEHDTPHVGPDTALIAAKRALNDLHFELATQGYSEVYVDQMDGDVVAVTRHAPTSRRSVVLVAFTAFDSGVASAPARTLRPLRFEGRLERVALEVLVSRDVTAPPFTPHDAVLAGLREYRATVRRDLLPAESAFVASVREVSAGAATEVTLRPLPPGAVLALRVAPAPPAAAALAELHVALAVVAAPTPGDPWRLAPALAPLELADYNALLYRCEAEEREATAGLSVYEVPGHGPLVYAGLQGVASLLEEVAASDDLGHPLCENLRAGDWLAEYCVSRVERAPRLAAVAAVYRAALRPLAALPRFLVPSYFAAVVGELHAAVTRAALVHIVPRPASELERALALTSVQLTGRVPSAPLPLAGDADGGGSLSAGLPHFATGYMRCWGRDTFVSLRGLYLLTGRYGDARRHILGYAACLRHGLIPNLLDGGRAARYNCRDATWWWLLAVQQYVREVPAPEGAALLAAPVARLYPTDDSEPQPPGAAAPQPLHDVVQEALDRHFQGLTFRERNAGRAIDAHMADNGFNVTIGIDPETGFPFGGNDANCGTWMDKMGSSDRAGTRGTPATPRDGSAVELVALAYSAAVWLGAAHRAGQYPHPGLVRRHRDGALTAWTWAQWADRIRAHFERHFWVPAAPSAADARPDLVHRRAIYKDTHGATRPWADYQLRCNFAVAMAVAPDLFDPRHAWAALDQVEALLLGPLGLKTLDPADWAYRPDYDNSNDGDDPSVAHGYNYHQGPEWTWPLGFYLRARLAFAHECGRHARTVAACYRALGPLLHEVRVSPWRGLPELSNAGGAPCAGSCRSQAWSSGAVLEAVRALHEARRARPLPPD